MYPSGELDQLAVRKAAIRLRIAGHRWQCVQTGAELARPIEWVDDAWDQWRRISPVAKAVGLPVLLMVMKKFSGRLGGFASLAKWAPMVFQTARMFAGQKKEPV
jgi:hypothetical protein